MIDTINRDRMIQTLQSLIRQPSVSATGEGIQECVNLIHDTLHESGINAKTLYMEGHAPLVYGEIDGDHPKTILFYNHYDVQPAEPLELWEHPPFGGSIQDGKVYGRGATDDKGELVARIEAVRSLAESGNLHCNVKFVIEGDEENGSRGIPSYLKRYGSMLKCDGVVWEFGYVDNNDTPIVGLGMKGMLYMTLRARGPRRDIHSGMAPIIQNPIWRIVGALSVLASPTGRVTIPNWYRDAQPLTQDEIDIVDDMPFDEDALKDELGISKFIQEGKSVKRELVDVATCNIAGIVSGYTGEGTKTVLPSAATAKLDMRLLPGMVPDVQLRMLREHLYRCGFGDVKTNAEHGQRGIRAPPSHPFVQAVRNAVDATYGRHILNVMYPETGPIWQFSDTLKVPCVLVGGTHIQSRIHSPNEFARIDLLEKTADTMVNLLNTI
ncbi:MAG: M20/M25/M40 family metallo-hydrolase [Cenarchaeum sp. SB0665_bin_23]|nr:M20/M25/M40 family metallo-hydrolase [Cenarchaeum sp. SB0667_bin_13]MXY37357.1 M20/M25/M40 family metallo-hydrolase [Cenarchaeum sp. SB0664_bin_35]MXY61557.1 M20/M25/M40 family metallo-hydrolase [Cenarchaeum sp. SB0665_bin_23]MXZ93046.1 M20/M25/M40 family metallo-hydrolase [Cenarchaeum sp. SB0666_bin_15]MYB46442.1 M20/M25/M40 family metallo-hydrolase [Cenarchaeum sp. SB0662_bin_33]MYC79141.1 M20/M25/M40 family metallo-hydrolase [Cenarchaeum sp. SB0661_bin_35]MYD58057.1 M20/M25/M40 family m